MNNKEKLIILIHAGPEKNLPETLLYTSARLRNNGEDNIRLIKISEKRGLESYDIPHPKSNNLKILFWRDSWLLPDYYRKAIHACRSIKKSHNGEIIASGYLPTMAPNLFNGVKDIDKVIVGYPWASLKWLNSDEEIIKCKHYGELPPELTLKRGINSLCNKEPLMLNSVSEFNYYFTMNCNNGCSFCHNSSQFRELGGATQKSFNRIKEELEFIHERFGLNKIAPKDNNYSVDSDEGIKALNYIIKDPDLKISGSLDYLIRDLNEEVLNLLSQAGVQMIFFGFESADEEVRKTLNKPFTDKKLSDVLKYGEEVGINFNGNLMLGVNKSADTPLKTSDIDANKKRVIDLMKKHNNLNLQIVTFFPHIGTPLGDKIWADSERKPNLEEYLKLIEVMVYNKKMNSGLPLPPIYESTKVLNYASEVSEAIKQINYPKIYSSTHDKFHHSQIIEPLLKMRSRLYSQVLKKDIPLSLLKLEMKVFKKIEKSYQYIPLE